MTLHYIDASLYFFLFFLHFGIAAYKSVEARSSVSRRKEEEKSFRINIQAVQYERKKVMITKTFIHSLE